MKTAKLTVTSPAFENRGLIPEKYTCEWDDINPSLQNENIPENAKSLVLVVEDLDTAKRIFTHCIR